MFRILTREMLTPNICKMEVEAPRIAKAALPGQFLIVRPNEKGERIPLTISDYNIEKGTVTIVTQLIGASSAAIIATQEGEFFNDVVGPLGNPSAFVGMSDEELKGKKYIFIAGGVGTAPVYPQAKWLHEKGVAVDVIIGAKTKDLLIYKYPVYEDEPFSKENIIKNRNAILKENVPGMFENTYMTTSEYFPVQAENIKYRGRYFTQVRGMWDVQNDYMGGPFVSHSFYSPDGKEIIVAEGFVYAPGHNKRQHLRQVESVIYSWEWKQNEEK